MSWVEVTLIPVEVFAAGCSTKDCSINFEDKGRPPPCGDKDGCTFGYGFSDSVFPWSDCNRARGVVFRADDIKRVDQGEYQAEVESRCVTIRVREEDVHKFGPNVIVHASKAWSTNEA